MSIVVNSITIIYTLNTIPSQHVIYVQKIKKQSMYRCPWDPQVVQPNKALHGTFLGPPHTVRPVGLGPGGPKKVPRINKVPRIANSVQRTHTPLNILWHYYNVIDCNFI